MIYSPQYRDTDYISLHGSVTAMCASAQSPELDLLLNTVTETLAVQKLPYWTLSQW